MLHPNSAWMNSQRNSGQELLLIGKGGISLSQYISDPIEKWIG